MSKVLIILEISTYLEASRYITLYLHDTNNKNAFLDLALCHQPLIPAFGQKRREGCKLKSSLRPCLKKLFSEIIYKNNKYIFKDKYNRFFSKL
jgi:hypothetical protein